MTNQTPGRPDTLDGEAGAMRRLAARGWRPAAAIDGGAYKGAWTFEMRRVWPGTPALMVEAQAGLMPNLVGIARMLGENVKAVQALLSDQPGKTVKFYTPQFEGGTTGASMYPEQMGLPLSVSEAVTTTLDDLVAAWQGPRFNFLKLDLQGAETDALRGAPEVLRNVEVIQIELSLVPYNLGAPLLAEMVERLLALGYVLYDLCDLRRGGDETLYQLDALFVRKDHWLRPGGRSA